MEKISPVQHYTKWHPDMTTEIAADSESALTADKNSQEDTRIYSDGSAIDNRVGAAAVLMRGKVEVDEAPRDNLRRYDGAEASYAQTKAMGDADHEAGRTHLKNKHTADIHTIFVKKDDVPKPGYVCTICEKNGVPAHHCFFKGACCKNLQIPMHIQGSLDGIVVHQPWAPIFTTSSLLDYIVKLVVCEDKDILHQEALHEEIIKKAKATEVCVKKILKDIPSKVSFTSDAWTSDAVFTNTINTDKKYKSDVQRWDPAEGHIICMEHTINLAARHFLMAISPTSSCKLLKKIKVAVKCLDINFDALDVSLDGINYEGVDECEEDDDEDDEFEVGDSNGKALVLVKQIHASPQARTFFAQSCKQADVSVLELTQWIRTRWASMHSFITCMLLLQKGVNLCVELADDRLGELKLVHKVLQEPASVMQTFSSLSDPSIWQTIPVLEFLQKSWENMAALPRFSQVRDTILKGLNNVAKWYDKTKATNAYFICLALDPNVKLPILSISGIQNPSKSVSKILNECLTTPVDADIKQAPPGQAQYGCSWVLAAVQAHVSGLRKTRDEHISDVDCATTAQPENRHPTLSCLGQGMHTHLITPSLGLLLNLLHMYLQSPLEQTGDVNRLNKDVFENLQLLKSTYRNGHISAASDAKQHLDLVIATLHDNTDDEDGELV
ncbi:hypothetical protein BDR05DRAFT_945396 [Suillus weaverae]|nr:hypothetical protein BDR05DRAFT_945396 [Suillus weaverae]